MKFYAVRYISSRLYRHIRRRHRGAAAPFFPHTQARNKIPDPQSFGDRDHCHTQQFRLGGIFDHRKSGGLRGYFVPHIFLQLLYVFALYLRSHKNKESAGFRWFATFTAYGGTIGALISLFYPDFYLAQPDFWDWGIFKSFLSHSTMMIGCLYLFVGGYVKIRVFNLIPFAAGLLGTWIVGMAINGLFAACGLEPPNAMFLQYSPIAEIPFFNGYGIALLMICLIFLFTAVWEFFACPKGGRWYNRFRAVLLLKKYPKDRDQL
ncbi:MAG TPA: YwaF family protein [Candidatus Borkfalkia excrementigallinarum]|uniref:YwaF family protein n=1 Tax=Candidatus Borkfalkia excrementigallinarum TaxID=2838506 RepID=A0A9D1ZVA1_9FIRM|nr:YwaF family protein [Candidatus Borkfalkia excrementigallinarum]